MCEKRNGKCAKIAYSNPLTFELHSCKLCPRNGEKSTEMFKFSDFCCTLIERFKFRAAAPARFCTFSRRPVPIDRRRTASLRTPSGRHGGGCRLLGACVYTTVSFTFLHVSRVCIQTPEVRLRVCRGKGALNSMNLILSTAYTMLLVRVVILLYIDGGRGVGGW